MFLLRDKFTLCNTRTRIWLQSSQKLLNREDCRRNIYKCTLSDWFFSTSRDLRKNLKLS
ncbi:hypothetical protein Mapa_007007 [Marchantia paleacea]|nr:hypothetical protein Mapa_007007 [Marchantia paleacea]